MEGGFSAPRLNGKCGPRLPGMLWLAVLLVCVEDDVCVVGSAWLG